MKFTCLLAAVVLVDALKINTLIQAPTQGADGKWYDAQVDKKDRSKFYDEHCENCTFDGDIDGKWKATHHNGTHLHKFNGTGPDNYDNQDEFSLDKKE